MIDFIFIGPSKTASTWVHRFLEETKGIFVAPQKDLYFFDRFYDRGTDWYHSFFKKAEQSDLCGEVCHDYFCDLGALNRIHNYNPEIKLLVSLRNPYERAISSVKYHYRAGYTGTVEDLLRSDCTILNESLYGKNLSQIFSIFSRENVKILYFSELKDDHLKFSDELLEFLGVTTTDHLTMSNVVVNPAAVPRAAILAKASRKILTFLRFMRLNSFAGSLKRNPVLIKILFKTLEKDNREELIKSSVTEYLSPYVERDLDILEVLLQRSFSSWRLGFSRQVKLGK